MSSLEKYLSEQAEALIALKREETERFTRSACELKEKSLEMLSPIFDLIGGRGIVISLIPEERAVYAFPEGCSPFGSLTGSVWVDNGKIVLSESSGYNKEQIEAIEALTKTGFSLEMGISTSGESGTKGWAVVIYRLSE